MHGKLMQDMYLKMLDYNTFIFLIKELASHKHFTHSLMLNLMF